MCILKDAFILDFGDYLQFVNDQFIKLGDQSKC